MPHRDHRPGLPAELTIEYPQQLSRGLVLVKRWLLAIPQYLVVAIFASGWSTGISGPIGVLGGGFVAGTGHDGTGPTLCHRLVERLCRNGC
jgi:hypothetical protein